MFQELEVSYFRQHQSLTLVFSPGVVVLRGPNEKGKTTILEAMAYAMFGATALREPLEDVVTWGHKVGELKVQLVFLLNGVVYKVRRSKSGAEIRIGDQDHPLATGQKEVTKYIETLLGASQEVCTKLMLASQDDIKGALSKGPSAAIELIEALSNLGVIDTIIGLAQDQLSSGNTTATAARISTLEQQVAQPIEDDTPALSQEVSAAEEVELAAAGNRNDAKDHYDDVSPNAAEAQRLVARHAQLVADESRVSGDKQRAEAALAKHVVPTLPGNLEELRKRVQDANFMQRASAAATALTSLVVPDNEWEGNYDSLLAEIETTRGTVKQHERKVSECCTQATLWDNQRITQTACGLCGKDLSVIPEVVAKNSQLQTQIDAVREIEIEAAEALRSAQHTLDLLVAIQNAHTSNMRTFQRAMEFIKLDMAYVPPRYEWTGPAEIIETGNPLAELQAAEAAERAHHAAVGKEQQLEADVTRLTASWQAAVAALQASASLQEGAQAALTKAAQALQVLQGKEELLRTAQRATAEARQALEIEQARVRERQAARSRLESDLAQARKELAEMADNNALIKFLREARPTITDQLWGMVLTTVSSYFSDIRGVPSIVTREGNGFKVDGHNVAGLSGSTKDALGLSIRVALTKTFLPNASFLILDEASAACDDDRTASMTGMVAGANFEQVLWVTHDDIVTSAATQIVDLFSQA